MEAVLDKFVAIVQDLEWIGASTNFVTTDDLFFIPVTDIANGIGMDITLVKVSLRLQLNLLYSVLILARQPMPCSTRWLCTCAAPWVWSCAFSLETV